MVNRKLERRLVMIGSIWQIVSGLLTIFVYASYIKQEGLNASYNTLAKLEAAQSIFGSMYMFSVSFGMLFVLLGILNLFLGKSLKDDKAEIKKPVWFIILGLASYLMMDILGSLMFLSTGILALAKNKSISKMENYHLQNQ
jgi:cytochrome c biogenesis protein CcdA